MKFLSSLTIFLHYASGNKRKNHFCDIEKLTIPDHAVKWVCSNTVNQLVPARTDCELQCEEGFNAEKCKSF